jgi:mRNA-degrading endonuclease RelE of RelBE toxin-antitoxin system
MITKRAARELRAISHRGIAHDIHARMEQIAADPFAAHPNVERLQGREDSWRLRKGDFRAVYIVDRERQAVVLERVMHRREVYR